MSLRRVYETTIIINAALEDPDIDSVISKVTGYIENNGGEIQEVNKWGRRRLAYPINKKFNGFYTHIVHETVPASLPVLERFLVLEDTVLRHLTLQLSQELRDLRAHRAVEEEKRREEEEASSKEGESSESEKSERKARKQVVKTEVKTEAKPEEKTEEKTEEKAEAGSEEETA